MATLMIRGISFLFVRHHDRAAFRTHQNLVLRPFEVLHRHRFLVEPRGTQCRFVDQVCKVSTRKTRGASSNHVNVYVVTEWNLSSVNGEDSFPSFDVRPLDNHATVKSSWTQQCRIEHVRSVSRRNKDHAVI